MSELPTAANQDGDDDSLGFRNLLDQAIDALGAGRTREEEEASAQWLVADADAVEPLSEEEVAVLGCCAHLGRQGPAHLHDVSSMLRTHAPRPIALPAVAGALLSLCARGLLDRDGRDVVTDSFEATEGGRSVLALALMMRRGLERARQGADVPPAEPGQG